MEVELDINSIRSRQYGTHAYTYTDAEVILYAISIGCTEKDMRYVYENHPLFSPLPTFAVIPAFPVTDMVPLQHYLPRFDPTKLLHGEHYVEILSPIPTAGQLRTRPHVIDIQSKGKAAIVLLGATTVDTVTNHAVAYNEFTTFIKDAGGFRAGRCGAVSRRPGAAAKHKPPNRPPDAVISEATSPTQAALYRLNGDRNPLHIDPDFAAKGGLKRPILHGLCTMGIAVKHVLTAFTGGDPTVVKSVKVRFAGPVVPGDVLRTEMWAVGEATIVFRMVVEGSGSVSISNAAVTLDPTRTPQLSAKL